MPNMATCETNVDLQSTKHVQTTPYYRLAFPLELPNPEVYPKQGNTHRLQNISA